MTTEVAPLPTLDYETPPPAQGAGRAFGLTVLGIVTLIWGTTFIVIHLLVNDPAHPTPAAVLTFGRFFVATVAFLPWLRLDRKLWLVGMELGVWLTAGYATQAIGLQYTTVNRSAFITTLHVVIVPAMTALAGRRIWPGVWVAAGMALVGTALLSYDGSSPNRGDIWTLGCALTYSIYIIRLEKFADRFPAKPLTFVQLATVTFLCAGWLVGERSAVQMPQWNALLGLIYLGLIATAITTWLQAIGQRTIPGWQASLLYTLEPVFASLFAFLWRGDLLGRAGFAGAGLLLLAALLSQWPSLPRRKKVPVRVEV